MSDYEDMDEHEGRREDVPHPMIQVAKTAMVMGAEFARAFRRANGDSERDRGLGLVEMVVLTIREGEMPGREFLPIPAHLPETETEMRALQVSKVAADQPLRRDLIEWAHVNFDRRGRAAKALKNAIMAWQWNALDEGDGEAQGLFLWREYIWAHLKREWRVDAIDAPYDEKELEVWTMAVVSRFDVTPSWLLVVERKFAPAPARTSARSMRPFNAHGGDEG
jgi:hypothetical protein